MDVKGLFDLPARSLTCEVAADALLTDAAQAAGVVLNVSCGGAGTCGGCAVDLLEGQFADEAGRPIILDGRPRRVLGCQTRVAEGPFRVRVPRHSLVSTEEKVVVSFDHLPAWHLSPASEKVHLRLPGPTLIDQLGDVERIAEGLAEHGSGLDVRVSLSALREAPRACRDGAYAVTATLTRGDGWCRLTRLEPGDTTGRLFGVAIDVGTTTVVCSLVNLRGGRIVETASSYNQQVRRCADVASRISYAGSPERLQELRRLVVDETINRLIGLLVGRAGIEPADIAHVSLAGNTVMTHLLLGVDPTHLGGVPFQPVGNFPGPFAAGEVGIAAHPAAVVELAPATAAYVGGDITADMIVADLAGAGELTLLVDIGTNAEIVVGTRDRLIACAAPAGPAFEGQGLASGVRASAGAIDTIRIDPGTFDCDWTVIDGAAPVGLCGSAMIDFLAQAYLAGLITPAGRFDMDKARARCPGRLTTLPARRGGQAAAYVIVPAERTDDRLRPIVMTEEDLAVLMQAKGVIFAAIQLAMKHLGHGFGDLRRVVLAGGFARHLDLDNAIAMGMLPDIPRNRYRFIGNGSLAGAYLRLVDHTVGPRMVHLAERPKVIELNLAPDFQDAYACAMFLPNAEAGEM